MIPMSNGTVGQKTNERSNCKSGGLDGKTEDNQSHSLFFSFVIASYPVIHSFVAAAWSVIRETPCPRAVLIHPTIDLAVQNISGYIPAIIPVGRK
jgi:hypothetical protein